MPLMQTIKRFCDETGLSAKFVRLRMDEGTIPEVPRENDKGTRIINLVELEERLKSNQVCFGDLVKQSNEFKTNEI